MSSTAVAVDSVQGEPKSKSLLISRSLLFGPPCINVIMVGSNYVLFCNDFKNRNTSFVSVTASDFERLSVGQQQLKLPYCMISYLIKVVTVKDLSLRDSVKVRPIKQHSEKT